MTSQRQSEIRNHFLSSSPAQEEGKYVSLLYSPPAGKNSAPGLLPSMALGKGAIPKVALWFKVLGVPGKLGMGKPKIQYGAEVT